MSQLGVKARRIVRLCVLQSLNDISHVFGAHATNYTFSRTCQHHMFSPRLLPVTLSRLHLFPRFLEVPVTHFSTLTSNPTFLFRVLTGLLYTFADAVLTGDWLDM